MRGGVTCGSRRRRPSRPTRPVRERLERRPRVGPPAATRSSSVCCLGLSGVDRSAAFDDEGPPLFLRASEGMDSASVLGGASADVLDAPLPRDPRRRRRAGVAPASFSTTAASGSASSRCVSSVESGGPSETSSGVASVVAGSGRSVAPGRPPRPRPPRRRRLRGGPSPVESAGSAVCIWAPSAARDRVGAGASDAGVFASAVAASAGFAAGVLAAAVFLAGARRAGAFGPELWDVAASVDCGFVAWASRFGSGAGWGSACGFGARGLGARGLGAGLASGSALALGTGAPRLNAASRSSTASTDPAPLVDGGAKPVSSSMVVITPFADCEGTSRRTGERETGWPAPRMGNRSVHPWDPRCGRDPSRAPGLARRRAPGICPCPAPADPRPRCSWRNSGGGRASPQRWWFSFTQARPEGRMLTCTSAFEHTAPEPPAVERVTGW